MNWKHLIATARLLAAARSNRPRQSDLKRSLSTAYYAMFHALSWDCADLLIGTGRSWDDPAWNRVYRSLDHGNAKSACKRAGDENFPKGIVTFADMFVSMQEKRHSADYDPGSRFARADVQVLINDCEQAVERLLAEPKSIRLDFAVSILMRKR